MFSKRVKKPTSYASIMQGFSQLAQQLDTYSAAQEEQAENLLREIHIREVQREVVKEEATKAKETSEKIREMFQL